ncbi:TetR/AcrR family transcriptional regulator [Mesobacterium pallidum]|uniref:TetR/AcrR family transcriptional regulator n=1 Tax=Mesobacterium pallidum TaxID=2872037 RepID=UPI001EE35F08|nr:TetR/AcrR family transcriptional regulator [Mesobacterium pallidum]
MTDSDASKDRPRSGWKQNPEAVKQDILQVATEMFAASGLTGTRIDEIAARTTTSKRMIYYYFGDKDGLWARALEAAYARVREGEHRLDLDALPPAEALAHLAGFTFDHHSRNPEFIRMVMIENIHHADYLKRSEVIRVLNTAAIDRLRRLVARGEAAGVFRAGLDPVALHWHISALSFFNVSNRPTFSAIYGQDLYGKEGQAALRRQVVESVLACALA